MAPKIETATTEDRSVEEDVEATLRDVRAFLNDPVALLERAVFLLSLSGGESNSIAAPAS